MSTSGPELDTGTIYRTWWPLATSWLLMGIELPLLAAVTARLADPELNLAAFGGVVFPVALLIEAPIIMMLAASTALCVDRASFARLKRFAIGSGVLRSTGLPLRNVPLWEPRSSTKYRSPTTVISA